jgi:VanZ family protein
LHRELLGYTLYVRLRRRRGAGPSAWHLGGDVALVLALGAILVVTMRPVDAGNDLELVPFDELVGAGVHGDASAAREAVVGALGNALLFIPLGLVLALRGSTLSRTATLALLVSGSIELVQLFVAGRTTSVDDVLFNVIGAVLGYALGGLRDVRPRRQLPAAGGRIRSVSHTPRTNPPK